MATAESAKGWFPCLDTCIASGAVQAFPTKGAALAVAREFGWSGQVLRIERRFEHVWIIGRIDFQDDTEGGIAVNSLRAPLLRYERENGVERQPVATFRRPAKATGA